MKRQIVAIMMMATALPLLATTYYISPKGNDKNRGTSERKALATLGTAQQRVVAGDTVVIMPGRYQVQPEEAQTTMQNGLYTVVYHLDKSGTQKQPICYLGRTDAEGHRPVFDFSLVRPMTRITGFLLSGRWITMKHIETVGMQVVLADSQHSQSENFRLHGASHCWLENIAAHDGMGIGFYLHGRSGSNTFLNCDAYNNYDSVSEGGKGGNSDGFGCHPGNVKATGNVFIGCRAWNNSDDGFDLINAWTPVKFEYCIAVKNGYDAEGMNRADGNGFKAGGYNMNQEIKAPELIPMHEVRYCIAAENKASGFYSNHHLGGVCFTHNSAYHNGSANYRLVNRKNRETAVDVPGYGHVLKQNLSYRVSAAKHLVMFDFERSQLCGNSFERQDSTVVNAQMNQKDFESLDISLLTLPRRADGMLTAETLRFMRQRNPAGYGCTWDGMEQRIEQARKRKD